MVIDGSGKDCFRGKRIKLQSKETGIYRDDGSPPDSSRVPGTSFDAR
jgi:hypothetical protein